MGGRNELSFTLICGNDSRGSGQERTRLIKKERLAAYHSLPVDQLLIALKRDAKTELWPGIKAVLEGERYVSSGVAGLGGSYAQALS